MAMTQNDTHAETGSLIDTIMEGVWFAIFWLNSLGVSLGGFKLQEVINSRYGTPRIADSFSAKICKAGCSNLFLKKPMLLLWAVVISCELNMIDKCSVQAHQVKEEGHCGM